MNCRRCNLPLSADHTHRTYEEHDRCRNAELYPTLLATGMLRSTAIPEAMPVVQSANYVSEVPQAKKPLTENELWGKAPVVQSRESTLPDYDDEYKSERHDIEAIIDAGHDVHGRCETKLVSAKLRCRVRQLLSTIAALTAARAQVETLEARIVELENSYSAKQIRGLLEDAEAWKQKAHLKQNEERNG